MRPQDFAVGSVYFMVTYPGPDLNRPVILSFVYLGRDIYGDPQDPSESGFYFKYLPAFQSGDPDDSTTDDFDTELAETPHCYTESQIEQLDDIEGLIAELSEVRERLNASKSG